MKLLLNKNFTFTNILIVFILLFSLTAFIDISSRTIVNAKVVFEVLFLFIFIYLFMKLKISIYSYLYSVLFFLIILYTICQYIIFENTAKLTDYLIMHKAFIYLFILSFFVGKYYLHENFLRKLFNILLVLFLAKYILMKLLGYGFQGRPELFTENNFELMMLLILYIGIYSREKTINKWDLILLSIIFILSGSRSGMGAFFIMLYFLNFSNSKKLKFFKVSLLTVGFLGLLAIFAQRLGSGSIEDIDRVKFFFYFLNEIESWNIINYLFGASFMTPMSYETSKGLSYYHILYSDHDSLLTYSVVLHSFVLRTIFDHGMLGFWFLFFTVWKFLKISGYDKKERLSLLLMIFASGLSVSSLNSIFVTLSLGLNMITRRNIFEKSLSRN